MHYASCVVVDEIQPFKVDYYGYGMKLFIREHNRPQSQVLMKDVFDAMALFLLRKGGKNPPFTLFKGISAVVSSLEHLLNKVFEYPESFNNSSSILYYYTTNSNKHTSENFYGIHTITLHFYVLSSFVITKRDPLP